MTQLPPPAGWYPDPAGVPGARWWDGRRWTQHARPARHALPATSPAGAAPSLYEQPVLVVEQKSKGIELTREYAVLDGYGQKLGSVAEVGLGILHKASRLIGDFEGLFSHRFEVRDRRGPVLVLTRQAKEPAVLVQRPDGTSLGEIVLADAGGRFRFDLVAGGHVVGAMQAEHRFAELVTITAAAGAEVARVTQVRERVLEAIFTTFDRYVVLVHHRLPEPMASLVLAAALTVDTTFERDDRFLVRGRFVPFWGRTTPRPDASAASSARQDGPRSDA